MKKRQLTQYIDILGILLIVIPFIITLFLSINYSLNEEQFLLDYLMPAELAFMVMPGALLIVLVAMKKNHFFKAKALLFLGSLIGIVLVMFLPVLLGFGSDPALAQGFWYTLTFVALGVYEITSLTLAVYTLIKL
jgi:hypothetical protein